MAYTIVVDTGGTFTDLVLASEESILGLHKAATTPSDAFEGLRAAIELAARAESLSAGELLRRTRSFIYATTHATNAVLENRTARTAFLTTEGHRDILLYREGGKPQPLNIALPSPEPYVPRSLTFEVRERVLSDGSVAIPLDEEHLRASIARLAELEVEAVGVCLLWAGINPNHEERVGDLLREFLPGVPYTLGYRINAFNREYRRASAAVIDASLKPVMRAHLRDLEEKLRDLGFAGEPLMVSHTSGGVQSMAKMCEQPLYCVDSGPALAPIAALAYARASVEDAGRDLLVLDAGGTSCDLSLVRDAAVAHTREKWLGPRFLGHMTGLPAVDTRSVGAGGGSIARVDGGGLLRVGPQSAGADPGPACYGRGGSKATVTDAAVLLGYIDPASFLSGRMPLRRDLAAAAVRDTVARPLGLGLEEAAAAIHRVYTERVRSFVSEVLMTHGMDPRETVLVAGGGSAGLNIVEVARELRSPGILLPILAAGLSAVGGQQSDLLATFSRGVYAHSDDFPYASVNAALCELEREMDAFLAREARDFERRRDLFCEARYAHQTWELDVPLGEIGAFETREQVKGLCEAFHARHRELFAVSQPGEAVEVLTWRAEARAIRPKPALSAEAPLPPDVEEPRTRTAWINGAPAEIPVHRADQLASGRSVDGPALIEEPTTTLVLPAGARAHRRSSHYWIESWRGAA